MIRFAVSTLVLVLAAGGAALADSPHRGGHDQRGWNNGHSTQQRAPQRNWNRGDYRGNHRYAESRRSDSAPRRYEAPRGYYGHRWNRGQWLPESYRAPHYYVHDYRRYGHRVYAPPMGYGWVRYDGDLILTALATGLVLDIIYNAY